MQHWNAESFVALDGELLEGPAWDAATGQVLCVDIPAGIVHRIDWSGRDVSSRTHPTPVSAVIPRSRGSVVLAVEAGLAVETDDGFELIVPVDADDTSIRSNDAKCDPAGRLWLGTMAYGATPNAASLYRIQPDHTIERVVSGTTISNGLGWSPDATRMYFIDTTTKAIDVFDYDIDTGEASRRRTLVDTSPMQGVPDGMTVDADGDLWVGFWGGGCVRRFSPEGEFIGTVAVPTPKVTSCAFVGPGLDHLVITTAASDDGTGGDLFVATPGVTGQPTAAFAG